MESYKASRTSFALCVCSSSNILMCVCVKFLPSTMQRKGGGAERERKPEVLINHKLSLQRCNVSSKSCA